MFSNRVRMSGLSGMPTEDLVRQLMMAASHRFNNMQRRATLTTFRQEAFRSMATEIRAFETSALRMANNPNTVRLSASFNTNLAAATMQGGQAVSSNTLLVNARTDARPGNFQMTVLHRATAARSNGTALTGTGTNDLQSNILIGNGFVNLPANPGVTGNVNINFEALRAHGEAGNSVSFSVTLPGTPENTETITLDTAALGRITDETSFLTEVQNALNTGFGTTGTAPDDRPVVAASMRNGRLHLAAINGEGISVNAAAEGHAPRLLGLSTQSATRSDNEITFSISVNAGRAVNIRVNLANVTELRSDDPNNRNTLEYRINAAIAARADELDPDPPNDPPTPDDAALGVLLRGVTAGVDENGRLTLSHAAGSHIRVSGNEDATRVLGITAGQGSGNNFNRVTLYEMGIRGGTNGVTLIGDTRNFDLEINGVNVTGFNLDMTVQQFMNRINNSNAGVTVSFDNSSGENGVRNNNFVLESTRAGALTNFDISNATAQNVLQTVFGFENLANGPGTPGRGTEVLIDRGGGRTELRHFDGNAFVIDGIEFTLGNNIDIENGNNVFEIEVRRDITNAKETILNFVEEYNKLMRTLIDLSRTPRPRSATTNQLYEPLTDEERRALSETELSNWDERARTGLLFRDTNIENLMRNMRMQMMNNVTLSDGTVMNLSQIGITTTSNWRDGGILEVDMERLERALNERPDQVAEMFYKNTDLPSTASTHARMQDMGIGNRLNTLVEGAIGRNGTITRIAGSEEHSLSLLQNDMTDDLRRQNDRIAQMLTSLQRREEQYWRMFSRMEAAMMQADSQMGMLLGMMGQNMGWQ